MTSKTTALFQERQLRPNIYIIEGKTISKDFTYTARTWKMINSSNVPANNVLVRYCFKRKLEDWTSWIICFSVGPKEVIELGWVNFADLIQVCYSDIESQRFYLYEISDWTGREKSINRNEYESNFAIALKKRKSDGPIITNNIVEEDLILLFKNKPNTKQVLDELQNYLREYLK